MAYIFVSNSTVYMFGLGVDWYFESCICNIKIKPFYHNQQIIVKLVHCIWSYFATEALNY